MEFRWTSAVRIKGFCCREQQIAHSRDMLLVTQKVFSTRLLAKLNWFSSPVTNHWALCMKLHNETFYVTSEAYLNLIQSLHRKCTHAQTLLFDASTGGLSTSYMTSWILPYTADQFKKKNHPLAIRCLLTHAQTVFYFIESFHWQQNNIIFYSSLGIGIGGFDVSHVVGH